MYGAGPARVDPSSGPAHAAEARQAIGDLDGMSAAYGQVDRTEGGSGSRAGFIAASGVRLRAALEEIALWT